MARVMWVMNSEVYATYREIYWEMGRANYEGRLHDYQELWDRMQRLPGYPSHDPDNDQVVPYIDDPYLDALIDAVPPDQRGN